MLNNFKLLYPNITVNIVKNGDNYDQCSDKIRLAAIKGGTLPNIVQGYPDHVAEYITNQRCHIGWIHTLITQFGDLITEVNNDKFEDYLMESIETKTANIQQMVNIYSLPFNKSTEVMIYTYSDVVNALIASW
jgi:multiple sugar transport system substrate-binding protein